MLILIPIGAILLGLGLLSYLVIFKCFYCWRRRQGDNNYCEHCSWDGRE